MTDDVIKDAKIHIGLVPDGNRRFAKKHGKPVWWGHQEGAKKLEQFIEWCTEYPCIKQISVFALSTENINRERKELDKLWEIYKKQFNKMRSSEKIKQKQVKINVFGNQLIWRADVRQAAKDAMAATTGFSRLILNILLAYGSKFEIVSAAKQLIKRGIKRFKPTEDLLNKFLLVSQPVDLIIRTGNQFRLSNFLLYQSAYAEIYFSKSLWPEFSRKEFDKIMQWYAKQQKKFGV